MTSPEIKTKRCTAFTTPFVDARHTTSYNDDSCTMNNGAGGDCSFSSDDLNVCRWQETTPASPCTQKDGRCVVTETDLDTGVRRSLDLLRETDLDRAVSMLSLHVTTTSPSAGSPGTRRSFSHLPTTERTPSPENPKLNTAISASELRFIEARERLTPPTWWTRRGVSSASVTPSRMKNLDRLSRSQVSLGSSDRSYGVHSPRTPQLSPRIVYPDASPMCSPMLVPRQSRQRAVSATPRLTSRNNCQSNNSNSTNFSLPSEELVFINKIK